MMRRYVENIVRFRIAVIILIAIVTVLIGSRIKEMTYSPTQSIGVSKTKLVDLYEFAGTRSDVLDL